MNILSAPEWKTYKMAPHATVIDQYIMSSFLVFNASEQAIKSVTVFKSSKAEVVRTFSLLLKVRIPIQIKALYTSLGHDSDLVL